MSPSYSRTLQSITERTDLSPAWAARRGEASALLRALREWRGTHDEDEVLLGFVPGRIEVFGRHTDYAGGRTIVCALDRGFLFTAARSSEPRIRLREDSAEFHDVDFPLSADLAPRTGDWSNYPMTMIRRLARNFPGALRGMDLIFSSSLPVGSGMSGSSALMMMVYAAIAVLSGLEGSLPFIQNIGTPVDLAVYLACAENGQGFRGLAGDTGVGTFGGSEDHAAILNARDGMLSLFGFSPPALLAEAAWPADWAMVAAFSGVRAEKTREALEKYNLASRRVRDAVSVFNELAGTRCTTLREIVDNERASGASRWLRELDRAGRRRADTASALSDRVRQFLLEDRDHVPGAMAALRDGDLTRFGALLSRSHEASKRYLWNIAPEIDWLAKTARRLGAAGASGFGAGFGGSILAVTEADRAGPLVEEWRRRYQARWADRAAESSFFVARPSNGIEIWTDAGPVRYVDAVISPGRSSPQ